MFVQFFQGLTEERRGLREVFDRWADDVAPTADGFVDGVAGVTADGRLVSAARFASEQQARANSDRPEQGEWWEELAASLSGEPSFRESTDVRGFLDGPAANARFVQVIEGRATDREVFERIMEADEEWLRRERPEVIGGYLAWHDHERFTLVVFFTDEAAARQGEHKNEEGPGADLSEVVTGASYHDLSEPWIFAP